MPSNVKRPIVVGDGGLAVVGGFALHVQDDGDADDAVGLG